MCGMKLKGLTVVFASLVMLSLGAASLPVSAGLRAEWNGATLRIVDDARGETLFRIPGARLMLPSFATNAEASVTVAADGLRVAYAHPLLARGEATLRPVASGLALAATFVPKADVVMNRLELFPRGAETTCYELRNFKNSQGTPAVWPRVPLQCNPFRINTYSKDWQFAPHPTAMLFARNPAQVIVGATCAPVGGYGLYAEGKKGVFDGFWLDYGPGEWGWKIRAGEEWKSPEFRLLLDRTDDAFHAYAKFGEMLVADGFVKDPATRPFVAWHHDNVYCTWNDQSHLSGYVPDADLQKQSKANPSLRNKSWVVLTEKLVRDAADIIEREKLPFKTILIDGGWMYNTMDFRADASRFPDFRGLVDDLHARGFKVIVWWTWSEIRDAGCEAAIGVRNTMLNGKRNCHGRMMADFSKKSAQEEYLKPLMRRLFSSEPGCYDLDGVKTDYQADKIHPDLPAEDPAWRGEENYFRHLYALFTSEMRRYKPDACHIGCAGNYFLAEYIDMNRTYDVGTDNPAEHENRAKMLVATAPGVQPVWDLPSWTAGNWGDYVSALKRRDEPIHVGRLFKIADDGEIRDIGPADFERYRQLPSAPGRRR